MATYSLSMIYTGYKQVGTWWNYKNVISPFYRLYYIESGKGRVYIGTTAYDLTPGTLFLIPKFAFHSYECDQTMDHYYICFFDDLLDGKGVPHPSALQVRTAARETDAALMRRYLDLNPMKQLTVSDPQHYDNNRTLYPSQDETPVLSRFSQQMESEGILLQLFSRFITDESIKGDKSAEDCHWTRSSTTSTSTWTSTLPSRSWPTLPTGRPTISPKCSRRSWVCHLAATSS